MKKFLIKKIIYMLILVLASLLSSCATLFSPVAEEDRDRSGKYDGKWLVNVYKPGFTIRTFKNRVNWTWRCPTVSGSEFIIIKEGEIKYGRYKTFINSEGLFNSGYIKEGAVNITMNGVKDRDVVWYISFEGKVDIESNKIFLKYKTFSEVSKQFKCIYDYEFDYEYIKN